MDPTFRPYSYRQCQVGDYFLNAQSRIRQIIDSVASIPAHACERDLTSATAAIEEMYSSQPSNYAAPIVDINLLLGQNIVVCLDPSS